ncbi:MAG: hypothetical protein RID53_00470 [Coleofasciculus sp. B1-GNL1-01]|uniref:hypothetical protein n=1 Tax=Coleofasciculus sp. B1-GNL1-01 TaxID=3068484 RepID=UPI003300EB86
MVENILVLALEKSAEIVLVLLVEKLWAWVLRDRKLQRVSNFAKMHIFILYLDWVLLKTPLKSIPDQPEEK